MSSISSDISIAASQTACGIFESYCKNITYTYVIRMPGMTMRCSVINNVLNVHCLPLLQLGYLNLLLGLTVAG